MRRWRFTTTPEGAARVIEPPRSSGDVDDAARIWAEATAARDGDDEVAGLRHSRPVIQGVLDRSPRPVVLMARAGRRPGWRREYRR
jgi:hypothetical protein